MGSRDRMNIASKMQINLFSWNDHSFPAASRSSFYSEDRPERGLTQGEAGFLAKTAQRIRQANSGSRFALSSRGRRHSRHHD